MSVKRKVLTSAASIALVAGGFAGAGAIGATGAAAASHTHCKLKHGHNYPGGLCYIEFSKGKYHAGKTVSFFSGPDFGPGKNVSESLSCKNVDKSVGSTDASSHGVASDSFKLPKKTKKGTCTLTLSGSGSVVTGTFKAKH